MKFGLRVHSLLEHLGGYTKLMNLKDAQIELLQNTNASLRGIIQMLDTTDWSEVDE